jgi:hypothetical protein
MERSRIRELHYITDIANVGSILDRGIYSHRLAARRVSSRVRIDDVEVQRRRAVKRVKIPGSSRALHDYANLYVNARNAMLFRLLNSGAGDLTVLAISPRALDREGVVVADRNAASGVAKFDAAPEGIQRLDEAAVFATWWNDSEDARQRCMAEVLVPDLVPPDLIVASHVADKPTAYRLSEQLDHRQLTIRISPSLFYVDRSRR